MAAPARTSCWSSRNLAAAWWSSLSSPPRSWAPGPFSKQVGPRQARPRPWKRSSMAAICWRSPMESRAAAIARPRSRPRRPSITGPGGSAGSNPSSSTATLPTASSSRPGSRVRQRPRTGSPCSASTRRTRASPGAAMRSSTAAPRRTLRSARPSARRSAAPAGPTRSSSAPSPARRLLPAPRRSAPWKPPRT